MSKSVPDGSRTSFRDKPAGWVQRRARCPYPTPTMPAARPVANVLPVGHSDERLSRLLEGIAAGQMPFETGTPNGIRTRATAVKVEIKPDGTVSIDAVFD